MLRCRFALALAVATFIAGSSQKEAIADSIAGQCARLAMLPYEPGGMDRPVFNKQIDAKAVIAACSAEISSGRADGATYVHLARGYVALRQFDKVAWANREADKRGSPWGSLGVAIEESRLRNYGEASFYVEKARKAFQAQVDAGESAGYLGMFRVLSFGEWGYYPRQLTAEQKELLAVAAERGFAKTIFDQSLDMMSSLGDVPPGLQREFFDQHIQALQQVAADAGHAPAALFIARQKVIEAQTLWRDEAEKSLVMAMLRAALATVQHFPATNAAKGDVVKLRELKAEIEELISLYTDK
jgi:hypothetical protein